MTDAEIAAAMTRANDVTVDFIKGWEGCFLQAYLDIAGVPTIGYGTIAYGSGRPVQMGDHITHQDAERHLAREVSGIQGKLGLLVTVPQTRNQWAALTSFCYNVGTPGFRGSTLRRRINAGVEATSPSIEAAFLMWCKAHVDGKLRAVKGLTNRRRAEYALYITPQTAEAIA